MREPLHIYAMDANYYKHKPLRVVWMNGADVAHTFCFAGYDAPQNVRAALARIGGGATEYPRVLEDYYDTRDIAEVLGIKLAARVEELARSIMPGVRAPKTGGVSVGGSVGGGAEARDDDAEIEELERMLDE